MGITTKGLPTRPLRLLLWVIGLSPDCSVLDLKSRFEIYGAISRTRMDSGGVAYLTFRMKDSAQSAIDASLDPSFGITLNSNKVQVMWANDAVPQWREGVKKKEVSPSSSKLLRPELPLSRHGRANKLGSTIVNPRDEKNNTDTAVNNENKSGRRVVNVPSRGREIVAYDDLL
ncbi:Nucleotide-binding, alpha-beta plait [Artemisia annua]|uniref:Nucleotide-binding, alpha-beta plait n=1 Tax=Artemisia annua TaxID=35608 RepID=A0A2U1PVW6_ARTAN|nr:Nucleotide-binding, alpha-beta plait [Artemisia annua]